MKPKGWLFLLIMGIIYADHQIVTVGNIKAGLYDDTAFGFSFHVEGVGTFLKPNRPPSSLIMMSMDGKIIPIGSAVGFFHQRPVITNGQAYVSWETRGLKWDITLSPMKKEGIGDGVLVTIHITNVEKKATSFGVQILYDVVFPFTAPVIVGNMSTKITQESLWQGRTAITQWAGYSEMTNLPGITIIAQSPSWEKVAFADWKRFYDYPGETPIRREALFRPLPATGASFFYPVQRINPGNTRTITYWMGISFPPEGIVKKPPTPKKESPITNETPIAILPTEETNTNITTISTSLVVSQDPETITNTNLQILPEEIKPSIKEKDQPQIDKPEVLSQPDIWYLTLDRFPFGSATLTKTHKEKLQQWFVTLQETKNLTFIIIGHTDDIGSKKINLRLGKRRAQAVASWLKQQGISEENINTLSKGETEPISKIRAQNRRVEITTHRKK